MGSMEGAGEQASPALQVIVLGSGGGPQESQITAFLVRSTAERWGKGSLLAVDAGVHLSAITKIIEASETTASAEGKGKRIISTGPFTGLELSFNTAKANAGYVTSVLVDTYLITHPHLDHISAFVVNTAGLPGTRQKKLAGLPSTIAAFSNHIFNNVIWPNLSDENNGAGMISYMRLVEGGSSALGEGEARGFVEVCEGLQVKTWSVSHGHCYEKHSHRGSSVTPATARPDASPQTGSIMQIERTNSSSGVIRSPDTARRRNSTNGAHDRICVNDSSVYFIRDVTTGKEVLIFGDVEPDSVSLSPRNRFVWIEAAPKIVSGQLGGIFIECSYDDSRTVDVLFGHLAPRFLIEELQVLASEVELVRQGRDQDLDGEGDRDSTRKRKRESNSFKHTISPHPRQNRSPPRPAPAPHIYSPDVSPRAVNSTPTAYPFPPASTSKPTSTSLFCPSTGTHTSTSDNRNPSDTQADADPSYPTPGPLHGLKIIIIHVKEKLDDGPDQGTVILQQIQQLEKSAKLGCEYIVSHVGQSLYF